MTTFRFESVLVDGFATHNALPGQQVSVLSRAILTSDNLFFHTAIKNTESLLAHHLNLGSSSFNFDFAHRFLLIIRDDNSAELKVNNVTTVAQVLLQRSVQAGEIVFEKDVGDIVRIDFDKLDIKPTDKILYCFKVRWKFGLFFDFNRSTPLDLDKMKLDIAALYRRLRYEDVYESLANPIKRKILADQGWFPFQAIINNGFETLALSYANGFDELSAETELINSFDTVRVGNISERWSNKPLLKKRMAILESALRSFLSSEPVATMKILLTEIEGVLRDAWVEKGGKSAKIDILLKFAADQAVEKSGTQEGLLFPFEFLEYLQNYTFANFDPNNSSPSAYHSRHAAGHGAMPQDAYTKKRALQSILTMDQIVCFL